jgi:TonB family protein
MKATNKLAVLLSLGALAPFAASAKTLEQTYLESFQKAPGAPVPISVVSPQVGQNFTGDSVEIEFLVDTTGKTSDFVVKSSSDATLSGLVVAAVKQWEFAPAIRDGVPVATKVDLPVRIVDESAEANYASN